MALPCGYPGDWPPGLSSTPSTCTLANGLTLLIPGGLSNRPAVNTVYLYPGQWPYPADTRGTLQPACSQHRLLVSWSPWCCWYVYHNSYPTWLNNNQNKLSSEVSSLSTWPRLVASQLSVEFEGGSLDATTGLVPTASTSNVGGESAFLLTIAILI